MRTCLVLLLTLGVLIAAAPASASASCVPKGATTAKKKGSVRVYKVKRRSTTRYAACMPGGRRVRLGRVTYGDVQQTLRKVKIAGTSVVAIQNTYEDLGVEGAESERLIVADLARAGRTFTKRFNTDGRYSHFARLLLHPTGTAAWVIAGANEYDDFHEIGVLGAGSRRARPVAWATGIAADSLRFGGQGVTWTQNGTLRTAPVR